MIEIDRLMIQSYGITLLQMMENAGRNLALLARRFLRGLIENKNICVVVGNGNNGGGGLVAARYLSNWGANVTILIAAPNSIFKPTPKHQLEILHHLPVSIVFAGNNCHHIDWNSCDLIIDAIFGYGLNRTPRGISAEIIHKINSADCPKISLDSPSGLDITAGKISDVVVSANATLTLALPKSGLIKPEVQTYVGDLYIADISIPPILYCQIGLTVPPLFARDSLILYQNRPSGN